MMTPGGQQRYDSVSAQPRTIPQVLNRIADEFPDRAAVVTDDRALTYAQLRAEVRRAAAAMIDLGVNVGDRVAIWSPNTWHWVVASLATTYAGAVVVPLNTRYTASEAADILARTETPLLIGMGQFLGADRIAELDRDALPALRHVVRVPVQDGDADSVASWDAFVARGTDVDAADARALAVGPDDVADILFTSGTTGRSKGVLCAHRQSLDAPAAWADCGELTSDDRYLCINPFFHNFGYKAGILTCLQRGATLIPQLTFDPERAMRAVQDHRITVLPGPPTIYQTLLDHPKRGDYDLTSLRFAVTGAATIPVVLIERMQSELDIDIVLTAYGLTEASGFGTMCRSDDDAVTVATTSGRPIADFELRIDAPGGAEDPASGEVLLRGPNVMLGYLDDPEATAAAIDADGWLHTGDIGNLDAAGNLRITDRLKDMYICGGFNVYPAEIEQVLARIDGVAETAVIGVPDERLGEVGKAFIVLKPGADLDEQTVITRAREHLANFKVPRSVAFLNALPRNPGGKVVKPQLREMT
jgi:acyl-CoA synthetase (AMP-forming)/AMP-acid ligase II